MVAFLAGRFYPQLGRRPAQMADGRLRAGRARSCWSQSAIIWSAPRWCSSSWPTPTPRSPLDISAEQERAADLVSESRLYRQTADHTGDTAVASVLDDLDRVLLEIRTPRRRSLPDDLEKLRQRLEAEGILFKIRVLGSNVRNQEEARPEGSPGTRQKL